MSDQIGALIGQYIGIIVKLVDFRGDDADVDFYRRMYVDPSAVAAAPTHKMVGGIPVAMDPATAVAPDATLEDEAAVSHCNISIPERRLRMKTSRRLFAVTLAMAIGFLAAGNRVPRYARLVIVTPLSFAVGFGASAKAGICGISQKGLWDPDGAGIRPVKDKHVAQAIWSKAIKLYAAEAVAVTAITAAFVLNPWL